MSEPATRRSHVAYSAGGVEAEVANGGAAVGAGGGDMGGAVGGEMTGGGMDAVGVAGASAAGGLNALPQAEQKDPVSSAEQFGQVAMGLQSSGAGHAEPISRAARMRGR